MNKYNYFDAEEVPIENYDGAFRIIRDEKLTIATDHLHLLEAAEKSDFKAMCELAKAFSDGDLKGMPRNYKLARCYTDKIMKIDKESGDPKIIVNGYRNSGILERNFGYLENAKQEFIKAIKIMCDEIDPKEWDYDIQHYLWKIVAGYYDQV